MNTRRVLACLAAVMAGLSAFAADLRISEIMPKPTDALERGSLEGMDPNGLESGWVELENISDHDVDLADYRFICVKRGKKTDTAGYGNFPSWKIPAGGRTVFYTSERYANSADMSVSAFATPVCAEQPMIYQGAPSNQKMLIWPDKVNPKKFPFVRLYHAPGGVVGEVVDTVVIPSDLPEGASIIVGSTEEGKATQRWICLAPTKNAANPSTSGLTALGPNVGPLYEAEDKKKTDVASEFALPVPPAKPGEDYAVTFAANPVMNPDGSFAPRTEDTITKIQIVYRKDLDDSTLTTANVDMTTPDVGAKWGSRYTVKIPSSFFPAAGHLIQWKFKLTDKAGNVWTSPSHHNLDDGYEWYGTIVEPSAEQMASGVATWHLFADAETADSKPGQYNPDCNMNKDASGINTKTDLPNGYPLPYGARVAIYDSSTSNYYDYVRIDLRGNTSQGNGFIKNSHGLRFAKVHPMTMWDCVTGKTVEGRKTSLVGEFADVSYLRQMTSFWLYNKNGSPCPFHIPVRVNLNGSFYKFAFNSERMTDELVEDVYGFDKFGYTFKSIGSWGNGALAGGTEKKTPDDENESDTSVLKAFTDTLPKALVTTDADHLKYSKIVAEKFDLPAWLNYIALSRITHETGDTGANLCGYYDNPDMIEGVRGTGTWRPLGYDQQQTFGVWSVKTITPVPTVALMSDTDFLKSHPLYDGYATRPWNSSACMTPLPNDFICRAYEAIYQSEKFRRLFVRRLRTLMDAELGAPDTTGTESWRNTTVPFMVKMREMAAKIKDEAAKDRNLWKYPNHGIFVWSQVNNLKRGAGLTPDIVVPANVEAALEEIWNDYVVPRRVHLYETHSVDNTSKPIGYGTQLNAGIPHAQSAIANLKAGITAAWDATHGAIVIRNANAETIDLSGWVLSGPVTMTLPAGTVIDQKVGDANGEVYVTADRRATVAKFGSDLTDQVIVGNGTTGEADATITLTAADGTKVIASASNVAQYLRLDSFDGITPTADGDTDEWITLKNTGSVRLDLAGVKIVFVKDGDALADAKCVLTLSAGTTLAAGETLTLKQADCKWKKITNGKLWFYLTDAGGAEVQTLYINQKDAAFANYYGSGGPGGAYYLKAQSYDAADVSFKEVASTVTESDVAKYLRLHSFDGVTPTETADTEEWITVTNISPTATLDLANVRLVFLKAKDKLEDAKCVVTNKAGTTLAPGKSLRFEQAACGWMKITNGDIGFSVLEADGTMGQSLSISQSAFADYYGGGGKTGPGGDCYLEATTFDKDAAIFEQVPYSGHRHVWGEWVVTTPATCTEKGVETRTCTASGCTTPPAHETREIAALDHQWGEWKVTKEPQVGVAGEETRTCERPGCGASETREVDPLKPDDPPSGDVTTKPIPGHEDWGSVATYSIGNTKYAAYVYTKVGESMTFEVPTGVTSVDYLVVGGGGSGGARSGTEVGGAGGGGGGVLSKNGVTVAAGQSFTVTVGAGADGVTGSQAGKKGFNSSLVCAAASVNAVAEGGGAGGQYGAVGGDGGCGGGGGGQNSPSQGPAGGKGSQGNAGGYGFCFGMGGGGGAGGAGGDATAEQNGGNGGAGFESAIAGTTRYYAAGGAGAGALKTAYTAGTDGAAATDGAGVGEKGADGLGAGGGGQKASSTAASGAGGSGVVIIRYATAGGEDPEPVVHTHDYAWTVTEPTCLALGVSNGVCQATSGTCDAKEVRIEFGEKADHVYEDGKCKWCHQAKPGHDDPPPSGDVTAGPIPSHPDWGYVTTYTQGEQKYAAYVYTNVAASMTFAVPTGVTSIDYLVVGGGGGGGYQLAGGGGGGGFKEGSGVSVSAGAELAIKVGAGGIGGTSAAGGSGGESSLTFAAGDPIVAGGGGGGGKFTNSAGQKTGTDGVNGSSGGGGGRKAKGGDGSDGAGNGGAGDEGGYGAGGGGGGAGGDGTPATGGDVKGEGVAGNGGAGKSSSITGVTVSYAGGGGGGGGPSNQGAVVGGEGKDHGGNGAGYGTADSAAASGEDGFGGGGGGGANGAGNKTGGKGGSGVVVVRYAVAGGDDPEPEQPTVNGRPVDPEKVFEVANSEAPIAYPSAPELKGEIGQQTITFGRKTVDVPRYYTATRDGNTVSLKLNDNAKPSFADGEDGTPAFELTSDGKVSLHLTNVEGALYYELQSCTTLGEWKRVAIQQGEADFVADRTADPSCFYRVVVSDCEP